MTVSGELDSSTAWGIGGSVERDNPDSAIEIENICFLLGNKDYIFNIRSL